MDEMTQTTTTVPVPTNGSRPQPTAEVRTITARLAAGWIELNTRNRPLNRHFITELAGRMLRGEWQLNGEAVKLSETDQILDGQHRLWALVEASQTDPDVRIETFVIFGLPPETQDTMDSGRKRTLADVLAMHDETNTMNLAATLNRLHTWELGESALRYPGRSRLSAPHALAMLEANPRIRDAVKVASRIHGKLNHSLAVSLIASCLYRFHAIDFHDSVAFWNQVSTGVVTRTLESGERVEVALQRGDPIYELRQAIFKNARRRQKLPQLVMHAIVIKTWNAFREGRQIQLLQYRAGGADPERFPEAL